MAEGDLEIKGLSRDTSLFIAGPPMTGKYHLLLRILAAYTDGVIIISTKNSADRVQSDYLAITQNGSEDRIGVIDCVSHNDTAGAVRETHRTKYVGSPQNLTAIGVKFTELFEQFYAHPNADNIGVGLHSASQLVMHAGIKRVYQFLQVLTGQVRSAEWLGVTVFDTVTDTEEDAQLLQHHFDGVIETRVHNGEREYRVRGLTPRSSDWTSF